MIARETFLNSKKIRKRVNREIPKNLKKKGENSNKIMF